MNLLISVILVVIFWKGPVGSALDVIGLLYYNLLPDLLFNNSNSNTPIIDLQTILEKDQVNSILYSDPFLKAGFLSKLTQDAKLDVLYLDLDLLYSGYLVSGMLQQKKNLTLFQPTATTLNEDLKEILVKSSITQSVIIVDSLNGLYNILNRKKEIGRIVTSIMMLIASMAHITDSYVVVASMVRYKKEEGWTLSPTGKRFIETKNNNKILLEYEKDGIASKRLDNSTRIVIPSKLIPLV